MTKKKKREKEVSGLDLLRKPFPAHLISKLPKQDKWMTDAKKDYKKCTVCGGWHHPKAVHLDYVGHAALTDRLLDCDKSWNWEPMSLKEDGTPVFDQNGGMWIKLTVCGVTRYGYGHPDGKKGGDAIKEAIGDALRNAAMRFGAALDLWHKGDLHAIEDKQPTQDQKTAKALGGSVRQGIGKEEQLEMHRQALLFIEEMKSLEPFGALCKKYVKSWKETLEEDLFKGIQDKIYKKAIELISGVDDLSKLGTIWKQYAASWKYALSVEDFADIEQKKDEVKNELMGENPY